jgi:hypothetical protein
MPMPNGWDQQSRDLNSVQLQLLTTKQSPIT